MVEPVSWAGEQIAANPDGVLIWTHGFFVALALRRGRIEGILSRFLPGRD